MKCNKSLFLGLSLVSILTFGCADAFADKLICPAGKMVPVNGDRCIDCIEKNLTQQMPENTDFSKVFCPGGIFNFKPETFLGAYICKNGKFANADHTKCEDTAPEQKEENKQVVIARAGATTGMLSSGNSSISSGSLSKDMRKYMMSNTNNALANAGQSMLAQAHQTNPNVLSLLESGQERIQCTAGKYLPANTFKCVECTDNRYSCPGGSFARSNKDQGLVECASDEKVSADKKSCEKQKEIVVQESFSCPAGTYLPKGQKKCTVSCPDGYICKGVQDASGSSDKDQGLTKCETGYHPNAKQTACEKDLPGQVKCDAGMYLPANAGECKKCKGTKYYCPSAQTYKPSGKDQGMYECPKHSSANADKTACNMVLSQKALRFGLDEQDSASDPCWGATNDTDYKKCIFGGKVKMQ